MERPCSVALEVGACEKPGMDDIYYLQQTLPSMDKPVVSPFFTTITSNDTETLIFSGLLPRLCR